MSPVTESDVVRMVMGFRSAVVAKESAQMAELADRYLQLELSLEDTIAALSEQISSLEHTGQSTYWKIQQLSSYQRYQLRLDTALAEYNVWAAENIQATQVSMAALGAEHAAAILEAAKTGSSSALSAAEYERIVSMAGFARDGSPLAELLSKSGDLIKNSVTDKLMRAVATTQNPRLTAREIQRSTSMALNRAMSIAQTEQMRVYRTSTVAGYKAGGVQQYKRIAQSDACLGCLVADGEIIDSSEVMDDHVNGHCATIPIVIDAVNPEMESAQSRFDARSEDYKVGLMGQTRYDLYNSGQVSWQDLGTTRADPVWGSSPAPTPVSQLPIARMATAQ